MCLIFRSTPNTTVCDFLLIQVRGTMNWVGPFPCRSELLRNPSWHTPQRCSSATARTLIWDWWTHLEPFDWISWWWFRPSSNQFARAVHYVCISLWLRCQFWKLEVHRRDKCYISSRMRRLSPSSIWLGKCRSDWRPSGCSLPSSRTRATNRATDMLQHTTHLTTHSKMCSIHHSRIAHQS